MGNNMCFIQETGISKTLAMTAWWGGSVACGTWGIIAAVSGPA